MEAKGEGKTTSDDDLGEAQADEELLMSTLGLIEDMFFDEVDLGCDSDDEGGGAWNAESKQSSSLREEIRALEARAADAFRSPSASAEEKGAEEKSSPSSGVCDEGEVSVWWCGRSVVGVSGVVRRAPAANPVVWLRAPCGEPRPALA